MKEIEIKRSGKRVIAELSCEIDHHTAKILREATDSAIIEGEVSELVLDFSRVGFMDSSGIGFILGRASLCKEKEILVIVKGLSPDVKRLVRMSGIERIKNIKLEAEV